jgi:hypothetical protein
MEERRQWHWNERVYPNTYYCERYLYSADGSGPRDWVNMITLVPILLVGLRAMLVGAGSSPHPSAMMRVGGLVCVMAGCACAEHYTASHAGPAFLLTASGAVLQVELVGWTLDTIDALHYYLRRDGNRPGCCWHVLTFLTRIIMYGSIIIVIAAVGIGVDPHVCGQILPVVACIIAVPLGVAVVLDKGSVLDKQEHVMSKIIIVAGTIQLFIMLAGDQWCTPTSDMRYLFPHAIEHLCGAITLHLLIVTTQLMEDRWRAFRWEAALQFVPHPQMYKTIGGKPWLHTVTGKLLRLHASSEGPRDRGLKKVDTGTHLESSCISIPPPPSHTLHYKFGWLPYICVASLNHAACGTGEREHLLTAIELQDNSGHFAPHSPLHRTLHAKVRSSARGWTG